MVTCTLTVNVAWWVKHYLMAVNLMQAVFGMDPNMERVNYWVGKGLTVTT